MNRYGVFDEQLEYEIDHIVPVASANNEEELLKLNHYKPAAFNKER